MTVQTIENKVLVLKAKQTAIEETQSFILSKLRSIENTVSQLTRHPSLPSQSPWYMYPQNSPLSPSPLSPSPPPPTPWYMQGSSTPTHPEPDRTPAHTPDTSLVEPPSNAQNIQQPTLNPPKSTDIQASATSNKPFPITRVTNALSSSTIQKDKLKAPTEVISMFPKLRGEGKAPTLAVKLAKLAYFRDNVMIKCTPGSVRNLPGLPVSELNMLKEFFFKKFSQHWRNPVEFESRVWTLSFDAVGQAYKILGNQPFKPPPSSVHSVDTAVQL